VNPVKIRRTVVAEAEAAALNIVFSAPVQARKKDAMKVNSKR